MKGGRKNERHWESRKKKIGKEGMKKEGNWESRKEERK